MTVKTFESVLCTLNKDVGGDTDKCSPPQKARLHLVKHSEIRSKSDRVSSGKRGGRSLEQLIKVVFVLAMLVELVCVQGARITQDAKVSTDYSQCTSLQQRYRPEGALGIRYKKQILQGRDMRAELHESHMLESAIRKKHFLAMFGLQSQSLIEDDFQLQQLCPSAFSHHQAADLEIEETFCLQPNSADEVGQEDLYMSSLFYKPRYMHISPVNSKNNEGAALGGITIQQQGSETKQDFPRDNSYLNLALNVKQNYELPIAVLDAMDQEQTIEGFLFKKAKHNNVDNFDMMRFALPEKDIKLASLEMYQRNSFTFDEPDYIASLTNGMRPNQIQKLKTQSSVYRFFTQEVELTPQKITFNECQQLIPQFEILKITNKQRSKVLEIKTMIASSPEITFYLPDNKKMFPIRIKPQESIEIKVALIAETLGLFEGVIHAHIDDWVYVATLNAFVIPNQYEISPFHVTDLLVNESLVMPLYITNPSPTHTMIVEEMYSTDPLLPLRWPNTSQIISSSLKAMDDSPVKCTLIPEGSRKHLTDIVFEINRTMDFFFEVHLRTSYNDVIRVPIYYHVHADILKLTPAVVDFGLAPLNFDVLKIPIYARSRVSELLAIQEILLPLNDIRLDFQMVDAILRAPSTSNMVRKGRELFLGYVLLNPSKSGIIESKIKLTLLGQRTNKTYHLDIPVVGMVHHEANVFGANMVSNQGDSKLSYPTPLVQFDVSDYIVTKTSGKRKVSELPQFRQAVLTTPLMLKNTFKVPIKLRGIVNNNPELRVTIENQQGNHYNHGVVLKPGETLKYAQVELQTNALRITQGNKYISVIVNNTLIPVAIGIFDRGLICAWEEHEQAISLEDIPLCSNGHEVNFDYVAVNDIKTKKLKITNVNPVNITFEQVAKQQLDDLHIYIERVFDKNGNLMSMPSADGDSMQSILGPKRTKRLINFLLPPYQTMQLVLQIIAKEPKQKFSRIDFQMKDGSSKDFSFNYKYHVISGTLTMVPQVIKFNPTFPGLPQQKQLVARSTFDVPITVKTITSNDMRIMPILQNVVIKPNNKTEFGALSFDPSKSTSFAFQSNSQMNINNIDIASMLTQQLGHIDPATRQNIMNLVQGFTNNVATQQGGAAPTPQIAMIHLPKGVGQQHLPHNYQMQALFTPQDIENYREKQRVWDQQGFREGKAGEITSYVSIETNVLSNITIPIRAQVRRPALTETTSSLSDDAQIDSLVVEAIDFDVVQVGTAQARNLRVMNPTDDPMTFAIFLTTPENFEKIYRPQAKSQKFKAPQPFDKDYHFQTFCGPKLGNKANKAQEKSPLKLDLVQDPVMVCSRVKLILDSLANQTLNEDINHLRRKLEDYFKDLFIAQAQRDIALQQLGDQRVRIGGGANTARSSLVDAVSGSQYSHSIGAGSQQDYDVIFYDKEIENITNTINQHSHARPLDSQTLKILKENHEKQKALFAEIASQQNGGWSYLPDFYSVLQGTYSILKTLLLSRSPNSSIKQHANSTLNVKAEKAKKKESKLPPNHFRLQSSVLNDLIVNNDTSKLFKEIIKLTDPFIVTYTGQSFFINPKCQGQVYRVEPHSNLTVRDAIIFQPQSLFQTSMMEMKLVLKNNLTFIHSLDLRGKSGTGFLEVVKILKKAPAISGLSSDHYINALTLSGQIYGFGSSVFATHQDDHKANFKGSHFQQENITQQQARILYNVYGIGREEASSKDSHLHNRELLMRANYRYGQGGSGNAAATAAALIINAEMSDPNALPFHVGQEDIVIPIKEQEVHEGASSGSSPQASGQNDDTEYEEENEYVIINRIIDRVSQNGAFLESEVYQKGAVKVQTYHKRALVIQNTGNLPLTVDQLSLDDSGCYAYNFIIENCHPFTLAPGEQHWVHIGYKTDYTLARVKKRLILKTKQEVIQEYIIEVNMPVEHMRIANELLPLSQFEEWQLYIVKFSMLAVTFTIFVFVAIDVFSHYKYANQLVPDHEEKILAMEDAQLIQSSSQIPNPTLSSQRPSRRMETLPPVLKTQINHEQVYSLYQQAQDKILDRAAGGSAGKTSQSQLVLLKEVANICSNRRTLVCLEAQKQALEADKEQRRAMQIRNQFFAQQARQEKERQMQMEQEAIRQQRAVQEQVKRQQPQLAPLKQEPSLPSDTSLNDSSLNMNQTQEQISNEDIKNSQDAQKAAKVPKISKKLKRDLEKKLKEQQEAEERFRLQQIEKQKREALELQLAKDLEFRRQQEELKRQERLRKEQLDRELEHQRQQQLQRERLQREREAAESEASSKLQAAQKGSQSAVSISALVEDQDKEKPEEYQGEKDEVKVRFENQVMNQVSRMEETKHDVKQQATSAVHYRVVNRQYESYKKPQQSHSDLNQDSQTSLSVLTAQSLTQKDLIRQKIQDHENLKESSFTNQQTLRQRQSQEDECSSKHDNETDDSFFIQDHQAKQSRHRDVIDLSDKHATKSELKGMPSFNHIIEEKKEFQSPFFERKKFADILEIENDEVTKFQEIRKCPSPRNGLSKEDLQPFFESQRSFEEKKNDQKKLSRGNSSNASPLLGSQNPAFGVSSIFSFNPLNIFTGSAGGANSKSHTPESNLQKSRPSLGQITSASNLAVDFNSKGAQNQPTDFNKEDFECSEPEDEEDNEDEDEEEEDQKPTTDLYSLFMTANSLLARPNFLNQNTKQSKFLPSTSTTQKKSRSNNKSTTTSLKLLPLGSATVPKTEEIIAQGSKYNSIFSMEEEEEPGEESKIPEATEDERDEKRESQATNSLFSGSLFGNNGIMSQNNQLKGNNQAKPVFSSYANNMNPWSNSQTVQLDSRFNANDPYSVSSLQPLQGQMTQNSALRRNQQIYQDNFPAPYPPIPNSSHAIPQQSIGYQQNYPYPAPPLPPPGLGYRPVTQNQSLYAQYNSGINYGGPNIPGIMGNQSSVEGKAPLGRGSFGGQGSSQMLFEQNQSFLGAPTSYPQLQSFQHMPQNQSQYQMQQQHKQGSLTAPQHFEPIASSPWSIIAASKPGVQTSMMGPPPGFSSALYGKIPVPNHQYKAQQRLSSSFQMKEEDGGDHLHQEQAARQQDAEKLLLAEPTPSDLQKGNFNQE